MKLSNLTKVTKPGSGGLVWIWRPRLGPSQRREDVGPCIDTFPSLAPYLCFQKGEPEELEPEAHRAWWSRALSLLPVGARCLVPRLITLASSDPTC